MDMEAHGYAAGSSCIRQLSPWEQHMLALLLGAISMLLLCYAHAWTLRASPTPHTPVLVVFVYCSGGRMVLSPKEPADVHELMSQDAQPNIRVWQVREGVRVSFQVICMLCAHIQGACAQGT